MCTRIASRWVAGCNYRAQARSCDAVDLVYTDAALVLDVSTRVGVLSAGSGLIDVHSHPRWGLQVAKITVLKLGLAMQLSLR